MKTAEPRFGKIEDVEGSVVWTVKVPFPKPPKSMIVSLMEFMVGCELYSEEQFTEAVEHFLGDTDDYKLRAFAICRSQAFECEFKPSVGGGVWGEWRVKR